MDDPVTKGMGCDYDLVLLQSLPNIYTKVVRNVSI